MINYSKVVSLKVQVQRHRINRIRSSSFLLFASSFHLIESTFSRLPLARYDHCHSSLFQAAAGQAGGSAKSTLAASLSAGDDWCWELPWDPSLRC